MASRVKELSKTAVKLIATVDTGSATTTTTDITQTKQMLSTLKDSLHDALDNGNLDVFEIKVAMSTLTSIYDFEKVLAKHE